MKKGSIKRICLTVGIVLIILFMMGITYLHFTFDNEVFEVEDLNNNIDVKFSDTSNVTLVNSKVGDTINKRFTVENTSTNDLYYLITLENVINNFDDESLSYYLKSDNGAYVNETNIIKDNYVLASLIKLNKSNSHTYDLQIKVNKNNEDNKTFSSNIKVNVITINNLYEKDSLMDKILSNDIKFENEEEASGLFYTNNSINGNTVYYYKGNNELNNNVIFKNYCFKIIRTTEDNNIRVIYNGKYENGVCSSDVLIGKSAFNNNSNYNAYVGYMYGNANSSTYESEHSNINRSAIMKKINEFYQKNLSKYSEYFSDSIYCNNRKTSTFVLNSVKYGLNGFKKDNTGYISMYNYINNIKTYRCDLTNDKLNSKNITYPISLITSDEVMFAGNNSYLSIDEDFYTMSPAYYNGIDAYNFIVKNGNLDVSKVSDESGIRPVITFKKDVKVKSGNGSLDYPYVIE